MPQNLISFQLTPADLAAVDGALKTLEDRLATLIDLSPEQRRALVKMGDKSEAFARKAEEALGSDVMNGALEGYAFLKIAGKGEGLDSARKALSARFAKAPRKMEEVSAE